MFKHLAKIRIEFNPLDPRAASALELLAQCNSRKVQQLNPKCDVIVKRRTDDAPPRVIVQFANGREEVEVQVLDGSKMPAQEIRKGILAQAEMMETEQLFRDAGLQWPVIIPVEEIHQTSAAK